MGSKQNPGKFDAFMKAEPDEPMFTLIGRDNKGARLVRLWAALTEAEIISEGLEGTEEERKLREKIKEAYDCAAAMDDFYQEYHQRHNDIADAAINRPLNETKDGLTTHA